MNVQQIRQRIFDQMDYFPDLQQYRDSVVRRMNDRYQEVNDSAHWLFLQKETDIQLRKQVSGSSTVSVYTAPSNHRVVVPTGFTPTIEMEGQVLTDGNGNVFDIIRILPVAKNSELDLTDGITVGTLVIYVEPENDGKTGGYDPTFTAGSPDTGFNIKFPRVKLPDDCIEVLGVTDRAADRGRLVAIDRKREEFAYLDRDLTGSPSVVVDDEFFIDAAPVNAPTLTVGSTSSTLLTSTKYEYKYTLLREGRESPPSPITQVTTTSANSQITVSGMDEVRWNTGGGTFDESGIGRLIYRRDVTNDGQWVLVSVLESGSTSFSDVLLTPNNIGYYHSTSVYYYSSSEDLVRYNDPGPYQYLRFWYVADTDRKFKIRYHRRPRDLQADNDVPEWPRHYHQLLVYLTLQDLFLQMKETIQSQLFGQRGEQFLEQMRRRFLARDDTRKRFARWDRSRSTARIYGPPSSNFVGP